MHYYVLVFNESSTEDGMGKAYLKLALTCHPDKNKHSQSYYVMLMINEANEGLEDTLRYNDERR